MLTLKKNIIIKTTLTLIALSISLFVLSKCEGFFIFEYLKIKLSNFENFQNTEVIVQFVNEFSINKYCYLSVTNQSLTDNQYIFFTYFPRTVRIVLQQILLLLIFTIVFDLQNNFKKSYFSKNYIILTFIGLMLTNYLSEIYVEYEYTNLKILFLVSSFFKSFIANIIVHSKDMGIKLLAILVFPLASTGYGLPWLFDFMIYFLLFYIFYNLPLLKKNKILFVILLPIFLSLIYPVLQTPSLETQIINLENDIDYKNNFETLIDNISFEEQSNTYLERQDIREFRNNFEILQSSQSEKYIFDNVRNLKGVTYPDRWKFMVSTFPDFKYHLAPALWYLVHIFLFFDIFTKLAKDPAIYKTYVSSISNILIFIPLISLIAGYNIFLNSFSNFIFFLNRNVELIQFGNIQTWRGLSDHYEVFSNLQIICFCLFVLNYYITPTKKNIIYIFIASITSLLPQSRWATIVYFVVFFFILIYIKNYFSTFLILLISSFLFLQLLPTYEREDPFIFTDQEQTVQNIDSSDLEAIARSQEVYFFENISDRLNRTLPWKMFASGYKPDITSLSFGFGPGSYLNIIKNTNQDISSGPHSMMLQVLNRFGIIGISVYIFGLVYLFYYSTEGFNRFLKLSVLTLLIFLQSLEIKTDSLMLVDGTAIFTLNLLIIVFFKHMHNQKLSSNNIKV